MSDFEKARLEQLQSDVEEYDEIHAYIEGVDEEKDVRQQQASFDEEACLFTLDNGVEKRRYAIEHVVYWYPPVDV